MLRKRGSTVLTVLVVRGAILEHATGDIGDIIIVAAQAMVVSCTSPGPEVTTLSLHLGQQPGAFQWGSESESHRAGGALAQRLSHTCRHSDGFPSLNGSGV